MVEEKYPLVGSWNEFVKKMQEAKKTWEKLQEEITYVGQRALEADYPVNAQKYLTKFRKVEFQWMLPMFINYYRGAGGLDEMFIVLPPETKSLKGKEKKDGSK